MKLGIDGQKCIKLIKATPGVEALVVCGSCVGDDGGVVVPEGLLAKCRLGTPGWGGWDICLSGCWRVRPAGGGVIYRVCTLMGTSGHGRAASRGANQLPSSSTRKSKRAASRAAG